MLNTTTTLLLEALMDRRNNDAWREFDARYRPVIIAFARKFGFSDEDAADVAQETLASFLKDYTAGKYDRGKGRLRTWIISIAKFRMADARRAKARTHETRGDSALFDLPSDDVLERHWEEEVKQTILRRSLDELRKSRMNPRTIRAFQIVALEGRPAADAAAELGMTLNDVYVAKNRAIEKLQTIREQLVQIYETEP